MAAEQNGEILACSVQNLTITDDHNSSLNDERNAETTIVNESPYKFGFGVTDFYKLCLKYYHREKKIIRISYDDKLQLTAYWKQVCSGPFDPSKGPEVGYFDVIGNDRRRAWEELADMPKVEAMKEFCCLLERCSPELVPWMEAQQKEREEQERLRREEEERKRREAEEAAERERQRQLAELEARQKALEEEERRRQEELQQLEEEERIRKSHDEQQAAMDSDQNKPVQVNGTRPRILPASLWTRPKVQEFIQHVKSDPSSVLVVGRGETMTVRVPTHDSGTCLFWEFATEYYDLGFGVNFEWSQPHSKNITVEVNESDDQDSEVNEDDEKSQDRESSVGSAQAKIRVDEILPVIRRPCNDEVIVGSHMYPGKGVYLLKFDNSYSLFRSKTLYYRVYYTR